MAKRISVINFKGGVGKTTLAFHLAAALTRFEDARVLMVDVDHQSSLSIVCLGGYRWQAALSAGKTVDAVFRRLLDPGSPMPGRDIITAPAIGQRYQWRGTNPYAKSAILPATLDLDDTEIQLGARHSGPPVESEWAKRTALCEWLDQVEGDYDYVLLDCPPATKIVTQNAIAASHGYIVPLWPEAVMERGARHLESLIRSRIDANLQELARRASHVPATYVPETKLVALCVTLIQVAGRSTSGWTRTHTEHLRALETDWGSDLVKPYIQRGAGVPEALDANLPVFQGWNGRSPIVDLIDSQYSRLAQNLIARIKES